MIRSRTCPNCGAQYDVRNGYYHCPYCNSTFDILPDESEVVRHTPTFETRENSPASLPSVPSQANIPSHSLNDGFSFAAIACGVIAVIVIISIFNLGKKKDSWTLSDNANRNGNTENTISNGSSSHKPSDTNAAQPTVPDHVYLTSIEPYTYSTNSFPFYELCDGSKDIFGNAYSTGIRANKGEASVSYRLDSAYRFFTFTLAVDEYEKSNKDVEGSVRVYADGVIIFERVGITSDFETESVSLDVSGTKDLTIELYGDYVTEASITGFRTLYPMICDPILYR
ncbi:MAG: NPCBM/NEW2 domain-containing protein [Clostridiales bacterium]|nr:NPCBM/NEW2 domain-containing protein [Clostridiales bacterium]